MHSTRFYVIEGKINIKSLVDDMTLDCQTFRSCVDRLLRDENGKQVKRRIHIICMHRIDVVNR